MTNRSNEVFFTPIQKAVPAVADLSSFYQVYADTDVNIDANSGENELSLSGTPSGIVRIITTIAANDATSAISEILLAAVINGKTIYIKNELNPSSCKRVSFSGRIILDINDYILARFYDCSSGDIIGLSAMGYDVKKY